MRAVDIKPLNEWHQLFPKVDNRVMDLRHENLCWWATEGVDVVYDLAADMGGMGFIETHKLDCMMSVLISTHLLKAASENRVKRFFYASSACVYPGYRQDRTDIDALRERDAYPADPEDGYGWEKLFSERLCRHFGEETPLKTRVARFHNIYGPNGTWDGGREKAPAAICRKIAVAKATGEPVEIWGDGEQTRSFCYVDDAVEGIMRLTASSHWEPLNIGSAEMVSINQLAHLTAEIAGLSPKIQHIDGHVGVRGRSSDNAMCREVLDWEPSITLREGITELYKWVEGEHLRSSAQPN